MAYSYDKTYFILSSGKFLVVQPSAKTILSKYVKYWSIGFNGGLLGGFESWRTSDIFIFIIIYIYNYYSIFIICSYNMYNNYYND